MRRWAITALTTLALATPGCPSGEAGRRPAPDPPAAAPPSPLSALELMGRDVYVREGCYVCHPGAAESPAEAPARRGAAPSLAEVGGAYPSAWHLAHLRDPRAVRERSVMPAFAFLVAARSDPSRAAAALSAERQAHGTPDSDADIADAPASYEREARAIAADLAAVDAEIDWRSEIVALIAYLQSLGRRVPRLEPDLHHR